MADEVFKAFIGGLPYDSLASDVEQILEFAEFTPEQIKNVEIHLVHDRESGQFKGFGYVTFPNEEEVEAFIAKTDGVDFAKRRLKVNRAQQRNDRGGRGGGRGGFRGDRGGFGGDRGGFGGDRGGFGGDRGGGFRRGGDRGDHRGGHRGGDRFQDGGSRGGFGGSRRPRKESEEFGGSQHEDGGRPPRQSEDGEGSSAPAAPAQRPRLNLKPRTTDSSEIEARKKQDDEETKKRQEKLFG